MKNIFFDLSMSQKATENENGMIAILDEKKSKKFKQVVVVICSKVSSTPQPVRQSATQTQSRSIAAQYEWLVLKT